MKSDSGGSTTCAREHTGEDPVAILKRLYLAAIGSDVYPSDKWTSSAGADYRALLARISVSGQRRPAKSRKRTSDPHWERFSRSSQALQDTGLLLVKLEREAVRAGLRCGPLGRDTDRMVGVTESARHVYELLADALGFLDPLEVDEAYADLLDLRRQMTPWEIFNEEVAT